MSTGPAHGWLDAFVSDFRVRLLSFLAGAHREMEPALALALLDPKIRHVEDEAVDAVAAGMHPSLK